MVTVDKIVEVEVAYFCTVLYAKNSNIIYNVSITLKLNAMEVI